MGRVKIKSIIIVEALHQNVKWRAFKPFVPNAPFQGFLMFSGGGETMN